MMIVADDATSLHKSALDLRVTARGSVYKFFACINARMELRSDISDIANEKREITDDRITCMLSTKARACS